MTLTLILGSLAMYVRAYSKVETEISAAIEVAQRGAQHTVDTYTSRIDALRRLPRLISSFDGHRHVLATFNGHVKEVAATSRPQRIKSHAPTWFSSLFSDAGKSVEIQFPKTIGNIGTLTLTSDPRNEVEEVWDYLTDSLFLLATLCFVVPVIIYWQLNHSLRPLEELSHRFTEFGPERRPTPVPERGPRELLQVYKGFNQMVKGLATAEEKNRRLNEQLTDVQEEERADLARDLHDEIGPFLFAVDVDASSISQLPGSQDDKAVASRIESIRASVKHMQGIVKSLLGRLRPGVLLDLGLAPAVENVVNFWQQRHPEISITTSFPGDDLGEPFNSTIYRIIQESLSNAIRHGTPTSIKIDVSLDDDDLIHVSIIDDGGGMERLEGGRTPGFGIHGMRERIQSMGGVLDVKNWRDEESDTSRGVRVKAVLAASNLAPPIDTLNSPETSTPLRDMESFPKQHQKVS